MSGTLAVGAHQVARVLVGSPVLLYSGDNLNLLRSVLHMSDGSLEREVLEHTGPKMSLTSTKNNYQKVPQYLGFRAAHTRCFKIVRVRQVQSTET